MSEIQRLTLQEMRAMYSQPGGPEAFRKELDTVIAIRAQVQLAHEKNIDTLNRVIRDMQVVMGRFDA